MQEISVLSNIYIDGKPIGALDAGMIWHKDMTYQKDIGWATVLHALKVPHRDGKPLGATRFANCEAAYRDLPDEIKKKLEGVTGIHNSVMYNAKVRNAGSTRAAYSAEKAAKKIPLPHPAVLTHPISGKKILYVDPGHVEKLEGLPEQEGAELTQQVESLQTERNDLIQAIDKLRRGIAELNREGRERLLASFNEVNNHFQRLFVRLFGGGSARLELTDTEDPLEAGLEIMASPPGKRMQILSLLSGGEQALTALSLLFGVFLVNPAPICVLDEVDAPLDDANVDRFCALVDEIAQSSGTRFLIITHHRLTMARMDRLFGVTMAERGVSQLVSVDLRRAEELRATA